MPHIASVSPYIRMASGGNPFASCRNGIVMPHIASASPYNRIASRNSASALRTKTSEV
ncbi:hypothetical protein [Stenomitos frigidus]|uniref:hypothetical protein n=1 Tax=Stenomitos frigidus TaxID=1886765 RepID=UPI0015E750A9|nr:hypothetical protein [Stenomitos frigidus]